MKRIIQSWYISVGRGFLVFILLFASVQSKAQVVINELGIAPTCLNCNDGQGGEFIELFNAGPCPVDLSCDVIVFAGLSPGPGSEGWTLTIPSGTILAPCSYYLIGGGGTASAGGGWTTLPAGGASWNNPGAATVNLQVNSCSTSGLNTIIPGLLDDAQGQVSLLNSSGSVISSVSYNSGNNAGCYPGASNAPAGCTAIGSFTIPDSPNNVNDTWTPTTNSHGLALRSDGTYIAIATGGTPGAANTPDVAQTACTNSSITAESTTRTVASCGLNNGSVTFGTPTGGTAPYLYNFNGGGFSATTFYSGLAPGPYSLIVQDANGCTFSRTVNIGNDPGPSALVSTPVNANCSGSNGSITLGAGTGGVGPFTYNFNSAGSFSATTVYNGLAPGTYPVIVQDVNGCTFPTTVTIGNNPAPTALATTPVNSNCGASNGSVTIGAVTGGTGPFTYNFNNLGFSATTSFNSLLAGTYPVVVLDANGCNFPTTVTVGNNSSPTAIATTTVNAHCGSNNGSVTMGAVTGGTAPYVYNFNSLGFSSTTVYSGLAPGSYPLTVKGSFGCTFSTTIVISNNPGPTGLAVTPANSTCGNANGSVTLGAVTGGTGPFTYNFNFAGFASTTFFNGLSAGTYPVTVRDANGCSYSLIVTISDNPGPTALATTAGNTSCGNTNGTVTIGAVTGGIGPFTYNFNNTGFASTTFFSGLSTGSYPIIVQDANGCTFPTTVTINNNPGPTGLATTSTLSSCGGSNGSVTMGAVTGGTGPFSYNFNGLGFSAATVYNGLGQGTYPVIVKDANGCTFPTTATVNNTAGPTALSTTSVNSTCGNPNGAVNIGAVTGGVGPYVYNFNSAGFSASTVYPGLTPGIYPVIVQDANNCTFPTTVTVSNTAGPSAIAVTLTNANCGSSDGTATLGSVTGGTGPFTYNFNSLGYSSTLFYGSLAVNTYPLLVKDANGCVYTTTVSVSNNGGPTALSTTPVSATCGASNGSVTLGTVTGGAGPYSYNFNSLGFSGTTSFNSLAQGTYSVIVKDANTCTYTTTIVINNIPGPTAQASTPVSATCGGGNGTVTIGATTGGTSPYTFNFNGLGYSATTVFNGLTPGSYPLITKDANACTFASSVVVGNIPGATAISTSDVNANCGGNSGSVTLGAVTGGTAPYTYNFNGSGFSATTVFSGLAPGPYSIVVQDANGCIYNTSTTVGNNAGPTALAMTPVSAHCTGPNGKVTLGAVTGGTGPFTYNFNSLGFSASTVYNGLTPGTYPVIIQDANGCTYSTTATVGDNPGPTALATTPVNSNCGGNNGSVTIGAPTGGTGPFTYNFNGSGFSATLLYNNLIAGTYPIVVKDANGCLFPTNTTVGDNPGPTAVASTPSDANCGVSNGSATIGAITGGTGPFTINFNGSGYSGTVTYNGLAAGLYAFTIKDANGCLLPSTVNIANIGGPTAQATTPTSATCSAANGNLTIGATTAGTGPYLYDFNNLGYSATTSFSNLSPGTYTVIVQDANGCILANAVVVPDQPGPTAIAITPVNAHCGLNNGSLTLGAVTSGTAPFQYNFNGLGFSATTSFTNLSPGSYPLIVQDVNGCTYTTSANVGNNAGPTAIVSTSVNANCSGNNGSDTLGTPVGGTGPFTFNFNNLGFSATAIYNGLSPGRYPVVVQDANGCTFSDSITVGNNAAPTALATTPVNSNCGAGNGSVTLGSPTGGAAPFTFNFNSLGFSSVLVYNGLLSGSYPVIVMDANGCTYSTSIIIGDNAGPTALSTTSTNSTCGGANGTVNIGSATGGIGPFTYNFNSLGFSASTVYNGLSAGIYPLIIQDAHGCTYTTSATVNNSGGPTALAIGSTPVFCGAGNGTVTLGATTAGTGPYQYNFNNMGYSASTTFSSLNPGVYTVSVKDANGCIFSTTDTVANISAPIASLAASTNALCNTACNGSATVSVAGGFGPYTYSWSPSGGTGITASSLCAGSYTCTVQDSNHCLTTQVITITQPGPLSILPTQVNVQCNGQSNATATANVSGGTSPYTYSWSPSGGTGATASSLAAGSYSVTVVDQNNCPVITQAYTITEPSLLVVTSNAVNETCHNSNASASATAIGGTSPDVYSWSPTGLTTDTITGIGAGTYTCLVTDFNGCTQTTVITITNTGSLPVPAVASTLPVPFCQGQQDTLTASGGGTYSWNTGATTSSIMVNTAGNYTVSVTNNCGTVSAVSAITITPLPSALITGGVTVCAGDSLLLAASGAATYTWSTGSNNASIYVYTPGNYSVVGNNNCGTSSASTIVTGSSVTAHFGTDSTSGITPFDVFFTDSSSANANSWSWNFGDGTAGTGTTPNHIYTAAGTYTATLTVTNAQGCTSTYNVVINASDAASWLIIPNIITPNGDGINDLMQVIAKNINQFDMVIFDRWGVQMFDLTAVTQGWDGRTLSGDQAVNGTYFYHVQAKGADNKKYDLKGFFEILY